MRFAMTGRILQYNGFGMQTLLAGLVPAILDLKTGHEFFLLVDPDQVISLDIHPGKMESVPISPSTITVLGKFAWDHFSVGSVCKKLNIDVLYASAHIRPLYTRCPVVVSVFDMMYHLFPQQWSLSERVYFGLSSSILTSRASAIAALSENTKKDILNILKVREDAVEVIYPGVPQGFEPVPSNKSQPVLDKYKLDQPYILYIGSLHPRKNVEGLLDAFEIIAPEIPHDLAIVGPGLFNHENLSKRFVDSPVSDRIKVLGMLPRSELPSFYSQAAVFVFPSLYEGFGFPVLEALACGCPTITTRSSSLVEVAGEAAVLVEPNDTNGLVSGIKKVLIDSQYRAYLQKQSLLQAACFSWENAARKTVALLEKVAAG
jgi:glycosyltransferase involved in cell wall biosynthesis